MIHTQRSAHSKRWTASNFSRSETTRLPIFLDWPRRACAISIVCSTQISDLIFCKNTLRTLMGYPWYAPRKPPTKKCDQPEGRSCWNNHLMRSYLRYRIYFLFGIILILVAFIFLGTSFIERFMKGVFLSERKIIAFNFPPVTILTVPDVVSDKTEE